MSSLWGGVCLCRVCVLEIYDTILIRLLDLLDLCGVLWRSYDGPWGEHVVCVAVFSSVQCTHLQVNIAKAATATSSESWNDTMHVTSTSI